MQLIDKAAKSIGVTPVELGDMLVDAGVTALPPSDGITVRYTLEDLGAKLWTAMGEKPPSRRREWYHSLAPAHQKAIQVTLHARGFATLTIAEQFGVSHADVKRTCNEYADQLGAQVVGIRLDTIAGQMQIVAEKAMELEFEKGNGRAAFAIEKDKIAILQSLGIVDQAVHKSEVTHKIDEVSVREIQALVDLEEKKRRSSEEIKTISAEVFDNPPEEIDDGMEDDD